ncbi:MAG: DMT family transporter, partial [Verrucomicrobiota bacterium]|nr:DMT family transporter [Verrucomicrobiota bacterium]
ANFVRLIFAPILMITVALSFGPVLTGYWHPKVFGLLLLSGAIGFGVGDIALFRAFPLIGSRLTTLIVHCVSVPVAATVEYTWLKEPMTPLQILCAVIILSGVAVALAPKENPNLERTDLFKGIGWGLIAAVGQGFGAGVLSRVITESIAPQCGLELKGFHAGIIVAVQRMIGGMVFSGVFLLLLRVWLKSRPKSPLAGLSRSDGTNNWRKGTPWLLATGLAGPALGVTCYQWALLGNSTGVVLPIIATTPLVVIPMSIALNEEKPSLRSLIGGLIAVGGVVGMVLIARGES